MKPRIKYSQSYRSRIGNSFFVEIPKKNHILIDDWSVVGLAPFEIRLQGIVHTHPNKRLNGHKIVTSPIVHADGLFIETRSGSLYQLKNISETYRNWLRTHRPDWNPANPITMI